MYLFRFQQSTSFGAFAQNSDQAKPNVTKAIFFLYAHEHKKVVTGTQLEVQKVKTMGTPSGTFFLGFVDGED